MTQRRCKDWITTYVNYAAHTEAPRIMHFWAAVWAISGVLKRRVWMDQVAFKWYPNFFIIFVAPPGVVSKSTTAGMAESFLRAVPGIKFGPDVVTWPSLVTSFAASCESFEYNGDYISMSPLNLIASELGNLIDPRNREMVNLFIDLWDGRKQLDKQTKMSGNDLVDGPWINMLGCTTPHWIADNMPSTTVGGGFTSRCIFVYADQKERFIAFPKYNFPADTENTRADLAHDLEYIATKLVGEYLPTDEGRAWVEAWYEALWTKKPEHLEDDRLEGYIARRQTHLMKTAMILAASQRDELILTKEDFMLADTMLFAIEGEIDKVFSRIGRTEDSLQAERFIQFVQKKKAVSYQEAYKSIHTYFSDFKDFEGILSGAIRSGYITMQKRGDEFWLIATEQA
jgi:hypothetical protein